MEHYFTGVKILVSAIASIFISYLGGSDDMLRLLIFLIVIDFFTGFMKGVSEKDIDADKMFLGGLKKVMILVVIAVAYQLELGFGSNAHLRDIAITYYVIQEAVSIFANVAVFTPIPEELTKYLAGFKTKK